MKNVKLLTTFATGLVLMACSGNYSKNPVDDLSDLRTKGRDEMGRPYQAPTIIEHDVPVIHDHDVVRDQTSVSQTFLSLKPESKMTFVEGKSITLKVLARSNYPGVKISLSASGLPPGAVLAADATEIDSYDLTWTAPLYTVAAGDDEKILTITFKADVVSVPAGDNAAKYQGMVRSADVDIRVKRTNEAPSDLTVTGLGDSVQEGTQTNFEVSVKVPGIDGNSPVKPRLDVLYDEVNLTAGSQVQELSGALYVLTGTNRVPDYLGNSTWKFKRTFDTKNIRVQSPLDASGKVIANATSLPTRLSFKVVSPSNASTPEVLKKVRILLNTSVLSPRFDLNGVDASKVEVTPNQTLNLKFTVQSGDPRATLKMDLPDLKTLPGSPSLSCAPSQSTPALQNCSLTWAVPCGISDSDVKQTIHIGASATSDGRNSDPTSLDIMTLRSKKQVRGCPAAPAPATPAAPAAPANPAPTTPATPTVPSTPTRH